MDIYTKPGRKVTFTGRNGHDSENARANEILKVGESYTVRHIDVRDWISYVELSEFPNQTFNTVMFEDFRLE